MQTVPAAVPEFIRDPKSTIEHVENISLLGNLTRSSENQDVQEKRSDLKNIKTKALVVKEAKADFKMQEVVLDEIRENEVLVEMKYSGICHTDIVVQKGLLPMIEFPAILGHEGAGYIRALGSSVKDKSLRIGDPVLLSFATCGTCTPCRTSHPAYCTTHANVNQNGVRIADRSTPARTTDGTSVRSQYFGQSSFAKMSVVNEMCVVKCDHPDKMDIYAPIGCGFQTGAGTVLNVLKPGKDDSIVVFGLGSVGLTTLMAAKYLDVGIIIAVDIVQEKLDMGKDLGATHTVNSRELTDVVEAIKEITKGGAAYAIDCTGIISVIEVMIECLAPLGTAAIVGVPPSGKKISLDPLSFLLENKRLIGVIEGDSDPQKFIPTLVELHSRGHFPIEKLCRTYPVEKVQDAIHDLHAGKVIKPVIEWS
ncbi:Aryl-alcohol dehydrogenase 2 [Paraphaeosphaeria sporulosa]